MTDKANERYMYAVQHATVIVTSFLRRLRIRVILPGFNFIMDLSQFLLHFSLRGENGFHQLQELHVGIDGYS